MQSRKEAQTQLLWQKKSKKFKTKYFSALKDLFGELKHDENSQKENDQSDSNGRTGSDQTSGMA